MKKEKPADPPEDIPAWFMTYSDVITLLMTFFILLMTFSTTDPERFEKVTQKIFGSSAATGIAGHKHDKLDKDSWTARVRPRAARMALHGSEMPPMVEEPASASVGRGLKAVNEEQAARDTMKTFAFELDLPSLVNEHGELTVQGRAFAQKLSQRLRSLPVHCALEIATPVMSPRITAFAHHLYHVQKVRPGQVGVGMGSELEGNKVRVVIERYEK